MKIKKLTLKAAQKLSDQHKLNGLYLMSDTDYRMAPGVSQSELKQFDSNEPDFEYWLDKEKPQTQAMLEGSIFDKLLTEREEFKKNSLIVNCRRGTKEWKSYENLDKEIIRRADFKKAVIWKRYLRKSFAWDFVRPSGVFQVVGFYTDKENGFIRKCKVDFLFDGVDCYMLDFKRQADISYYGWLKANKEYGYYKQGGWYLDIVSRFIDVRQIYYVLIQSGIPYNVEIYYFTREDLEDGLNKLLSIVPRFLEAKKSGIYEPYSKEPKCLSLPDWTKKEKEYNTQVEF